MSCYQGGGPPSRVDTRVNDVWWQGTEAKMLDEQWLENVRRPPTSPEKAFRESKRFFFNSPDRDPLGTSSPSPSRRRSTSTGSRRSSTTGSPMGSPGRSPSPMRRRQTLCEAVRGGDVQVVVRLFGEASPDVNEEECSECGAERCTPLTDAIKCGHMPMTRLLLDYGALPDQALSDTGATPLTLAADMGDREVINMLMKHLATIQKGDASWHAQWRNSQRTIKPFE